LSARAIRLARIHHSSRHRVASGLAFSETIQPAAFVYYDFVRSTDSLRNLREIASLSLYFVHGFGTLASGDVLLPTCYSARYRSKALTILRSSGRRPLLEPLRALVRYSSFWEELLSSSVRLRRFTPRRWSV
jgi:hypothetical protein